MAIEDIFKQRKDFVSAPSEDTLQSFFSKMELKKKAEEPLDINTQEEIKQKFSPAPVEELPAFNIPTKTVSPEEIQKIKEQFQGQLQTAKPPEPRFTGYDISEQFQKVPETQRILTSEEIAKLAEDQMPKKTWKDYLPYLVPLAVEAIAGGGKSGGVSYGITGKMIFDDIAKEEKKRDKLETRITDLQKAKLARKPGKQEYSEIMGPSGEAILVPSEYAVGKQLYKAPVNTGTYQDKMALEAMKAAIQAKQDEGKATKEELKEKRNIERDLSQKWNTEKFTQGTKVIVDSYKALQDVDPYSKNPMKDIASIFKFMKSLDQDSAVREGEQDLVKGARSVKDVTNYLDEVLSGQRVLTPTQIQQMKEFSASQYQKRLETQKQVTDEKFVQQAKRYGVDPRAVVGNLSIGIPLLYQNRQTKRWHILNAKDEAEAASYIKAGAKRVK